MKKSDTYLVAYNAPFNSGVLAEYVNVKDNETIDRNTFATKLNVEYYRILSWSKVEKENKKCIFNIFKN